MSIHTGDTQARDWPWWRFHRYVREGHYDEDWGRASEWWGKEALGEVNR